LSIADRSADIECKIWNGLGEVIVRAYECRPTSRLFDEFSSPQIAILVCVQGGLFSGSSSRRSDCRAPHSGHTPVG
jgi:hypothetical protein